MPIFMDRHGIPGATAADVAIAHQKDLRLQAKFRCRAMTYWFDEMRAVAFCLIEAPDADAVMQMHNAAHGLVPNKVIEVRPGLVEAFLGRIVDPALTGLSSELGLPAFEDAAFRTILAVEMKDVAILAARAGAAASDALIEGALRVITEAIERHRGGSVTRSDDLHVATFASAASGVDCAKAIQSGLIAMGAVDDRVAPVGPWAGMGICTGDPVGGSAELFGDAVACARRISRIARGNRIFATSAVAAEYRRERSTALPSDGTLTVLDPAEERLLSVLMEVTEGSWNDSGLHVDDLARRVGQSKSQLYRKLTSLTGYSPKELVRDFRLRKAQELLSARRGNVTEVAFEAGFASAAHFSKAFRDRYGILPSAYRKAAD